MDLLHKKDDNLPKLRISSLEFEGMTRADPSFVTALLAGGSAGTAVDVVLFPLDTVKTRLQSVQGFWKAGGFRGIYSGLASVALGSAPNAAAFFVTYESVKKFGKMSDIPESFNFAVHMAAASCGEMVACVIRVPTEVVKQRAQTFQQKSSIAAFQATIGGEGVRGLYRGYLSTVMREIPFSLVQYPIWEFLKQTWSQRQGRYVASWQSALCGAVAGAVAGAVTTPLDVAKTRIMLAKKGSPLAKGQVLPVLRVIWIEKGLHGLFAGLVPRVLWISAGGAIFLGVYEKTKEIYSKYFLIG